MLIRDTDLHAWNCKGHNVLHNATVRDDVAAIQKILRQGRQIINIIRRDGQFCSTSGLSVPSYNPDLGGGQGQPRMSGLAGQQVSTGADPGNEHFPGGADTDITCEI